MELRDLQLYKLGILKDITDICDRHGLKYFLYGGTLLGCIRHNGYIPWDDDVDIALLWNDYIRLLEVLKTDCPKKYFVQNLWTERNYPCLWTQIRVNGTTSMPVDLKDLKIHWGICIDVFALISVSDNDKLYNKQKKNITYILGLLGKEHMKAKGEKAIGAQNIINLMPSFVRHKIVKFLLKHTAYESSSDKYVCGLSTMSFGRRYLYSDFVEVINHVFEGYQMKIPKEYDRVLTEVYGDYMTPPPPEERGGHELSIGDTIIDANRSYLEYL